VNAPRCIILCDREESRSARDVSACLSSIPEFELLSARLPSPGKTIPSADVFVVLVDAQSMECALDFLTRVRVENPSASVLVIGTQLAQEHIFTLLTAGAYDFVSTPYSQVELHARVLRGAGLLESISPQDARALPRLRAGGLIGHCPVFVRQLARLPLLAGCDAGVLLLGETGTGKELFAQAVHYLSARCSRPWVPVNCSAIPFELIEAELFGHAKGAYTTAHAAREGLIAAAEGGTLFLDEIGSLPLSAQGKLLRFLQEREYRAVGTNTLRHANVRVIAASNQDLGALITKGHFRQDLYFRLNVLTLTLPPLRERREDIPTLAQHFIKRYATEFGRPVHGVTPMALKRLLSYPWPGNIRELSHAMERAVLLGNGPYVTPADIDLGMEDATPVDESFQAAKARVVEQFERNYLEHILIACDGNITHAAIAAKKNRRALWELIRKHHIEPKRFRRISSSGSELTVWR